MGLWDHIKRGYMRLISPIVDWMVAQRVNPNHITTLGTLCSMSAGALFASGHISLAGWVLGITAVFDVVDGEVARRTGRTTVFGAFYDSTLDRVADGALLGGLCIFFARNGVHHKFPTFMSTPMVAVLLLGIIGSFLTSYTRARAEGLGIDAKVGILQRPERITLLAAPQAFFGLTLHGWVLVAICVLLSVTAWITAVQRIAFVHRATLGKTAAMKAESASATPGTPSSASSKVSIGDRPADMEPVGAADASENDRERVAAGSADSDHATTRRPNEASAAPQFDAAR